MQEHTHRRVGRLLTVAMLITMSLSIVVLIRVSAASADCSAKRIVAVNEAGTRSFYSFADGSGTWSDTSFAVGDQVCLK